MSWFKKPKPPAAPSIMDRAMAGFQIANEHWANGDEMADSFDHAVNLLKTKYANFGCEEDLNEAIYQFRMFLVYRNIGPTFDKARYDDQAMVLMESIIKLSKAFDVQGLDIKPAFKPVTNCIMKDMTLVNMLEH